MRGKLVFVAAIAALGGSAALLGQLSIAQAPGGGAQSRPEAQNALTRARAEAARARDRAARLDRQAQMSNQSSERARIEAAALAARLQRAEAALRGAELALAAVRQRRRAHDRGLAEQQAPFARLVAGLQSLVRRPALLTLLQPGSLQDTVHLRAVLAAVEPQIASRTQDARRALERARELERDAQVMARSRQALQKTLEQQRSALAALSAAEMLASRRAAGAADREAERAFALGEQARDLAGLVRRLGAEDRPRRSIAGVSPSRRRADRTQSGAGLGSYRLPVTGAQVRSEDGGITLLPRPRAVVISPSGGRIAFAAPYRGYGTIVIVEHDDVWTSILTGLASAQVAVGQTVIAGSPLGEAAARNPRVGLELRRNGQRVDPLAQMR